MDKPIYTREELYSESVIEELSRHYKAILTLLGEDTGREGLA